MQQPSPNQRGVAHVVIILVVVAVLGIIGFAGYTVMNKGAESVANKAVDSAIKQAAKEECKKLNDDDLCKFYTSYKELKQYRMTSTDPQGNKSVFEIDGDNSHSVVTGSGMNFENIMIGKDTYMKSGDTWYKHTAPQEVNKPGGADLDLEEPVTEKTDDKAGEDKSIYKKVGKEACGPLQCFKYEVVVSAEATDKQFIWFDDKDYQLRRSTFVTADGTTDTSFEYSKVSIKAPATFKTLGENEYIDPITGQVAKYPTAAEMGLPDAQ